MMNIDWILPRIYSRGVYSSRDEIQEAGGTVTDIEGRPLAFNQGTGLSLNRGIVATNGRFHDEVIEAVRSVLVV